MLGEDNCDSPKNRSNLGKSIIVTEEKKETKVFLIYIKFK